MPVLALEQLDGLMRAKPAVKGAMPLAPEALKTLGWSLDQARQILQGLGFAPVGKVKLDEPSLWRRRQTAKPKAAQPDRPATHTSSPFAALAALKVPPPAAKRPRRRARPRRKAAVGSIPQ